ncbi:MAG: trigger factor [Lachnospiraceae bacterium]|nr:trigger factor [Lachnospiraceae bacterium]
MSNYQKRREAEASEKRAAATKTAVIVIITIAIIAAIIGVFYYLKNNSTGSGAANTASGDPNYNVDDYVTLGDYEGIKAYYVKPTVSDDDLKSKKDSILNEAKEYKNIKNRGAKKGDTVTIDFDGTIDGESFDGGTASDQEFVLGEGSYIDGFEEGIEGMKVDETKTLNLTFPKDYSNKDVAGKDVVFEVTLTKAKELSYDPKWNDEFIKKYTDGEYTTTASYEKKLKKDLLKTATEESDSKLQSDVWDKVVDNAKVDGYPEYVYNTVKNRVSSYVQNVSSSYGIDENTFLQYFAGGVTMDEYIMKYVNSQLVAESLIKKLDIKVSDKEYKKLATKDLDTYGVDSIKELEKSYGKDELMKNYETQKLYDYLVDKAKVSKVTQKQYDALTADSGSAVDKANEEAGEDK